MTRPLPGGEVAGRIRAKFPEAVTEFSAEVVIIKPDAVFEVASYLKNEPDLAFDYVSNLTSADYLDYFEVVYRLVSITNNHSLVLKTRCYNRENPIVQSVAGLWRGADLQEREVYDLMGIKFTGHPNLKRIFLWQGFEGHPLRKDFVQW